jgi:hypothetical protein
LNSEGEREGGRGRRGEGGEVEGGREGGKEGGRGGEREGGRGEGGKEGGREGFVYRRASGMKWHHETLGNYNINMDMTLHCEPYSEVPGTKLSVFKIKCF